MGDFPNTLVRIIVFAMCCDGMSFYLHPKHIRIWLRTLRAVNKVAEYVVYLRGSFRAFPGSIMKAMHIPMRAEVGFALPRVI